MASNQSDISGSFSNVNNQLDIESINNLDVTSDEFKRFLVSLGIAIDDISTQTNIRDIGYYVTELTLCGQQFFPNLALSSDTQQSPTFRSVYRQVVNFGALPNNAAKTVSHGITLIDGATIFTRIYATATNTSTFVGIPIPSSTVGGNITDLSITATDVVITTDWNGTPFNQCYVIIEFIKG